MSFESITDDDIQKLISCPKEVTNPRARRKQIDGFERLDYQLKSIDEADYEFSIFIRRNLRPEMDNDFSCGITWCSPGGEKLILKRYNGSSHLHGNKIEKEQIGKGFHIHTATERYIRANLKAEGFAASTSRYKTVDGALDCLVKDCNVAGLATTADITNQLGLFDDFN